MRRVAAVELRRRWRALIALGLLLGLAAGVAMAAAAGARRTDTAYPRFLHETRAADAVIFASQAAIENPDFEPIRQLPYVVAAGAFSIPYFPEPACLFVPSDDWLTKVDRPHLLSGRYPDPTNPDEVLLSPPADPDHDPGVRVGDTFTIHLFTAEQVYGDGPPGDPAGPTVDLHVVGMGQSSFEIATIPDTKGCFFGTRAFLQTYHLDDAVFHNLMVRLRHGKDDIARLEADTTRSLGTAVPIEDLAENTKRVTNGTDLERSGLCLFALAVALAAALIVGQALTRSVRAAAADVPVLRAVGLARRDLVTTLALPHALALAVAVVSAFGTAVALSSRLPIGLARSVDPDVGTHVDWLILGPGLVVLVVLVAATVLVTAALAASPASSDPRTRGSALVTGLARTGAPIAATVGASLALESGRGRRALPTRPALVGAVVGVLGVVGALTLGAGITDAIAHKERFGTSWDLELGYEHEPSASYAAASEALSGDPEVASVATITKENVPFRDGALPTFAIEPLSGDLDFTVLEGRRPSADGEVVVGPATAKSLGLAIGDEIRLGADAVPLEIVGLGLLPQTPHSQFDQGAWVAPEQGRRIFAEDPYSRLTVVDLVDGVDARAKADEVNPTLTDDLSLTSPTVSGDQENLKGVRSLPALFACFTVLLAIGALAHVSVSVLRRRRGELAVLRALGITPRQAWWCLSWQATILGVIGVVLGIPLGIAVGRVTWRSVADATPMVYVAPLALTAVLLAFPVTLVLANLIATLPGRRAARLRPAEVLRAE